MIQNMQPYRLEAFHALKREYRKSVIIGGTALMLDFLLCFFTFWLRARNQSAGLLNESTDFFRVVFIIFALSNFLVVPLLQRLILRPWLTDTAYKPIYRYPERWPLFIGKLVISAILIYALSAFPVVLGVVLYFLSRKTADFLLLAGIAVICLIFYFPRYKQWENHLREV